MTLIGLIIWLIIVLLVGAAILGVVRAVLNLPAFAGLQPYSAVIYALIFLLLVLVAVQMFPGVDGNPFYRPLR